MFERLLDLPTGQRFLIYVGSALVIVAVYVLVFYLPLSQEIGDKQQTLSALKQEQAKLQLLLSDRAKKQAAMVEAEGRFNQVRAQLPEEKEIPELLRQVSNLGSESGLEVILFRQKPEAFQDLYAEVPVDMAVRGGYHQVALFFDKVWHLDRIVNVSDIVLKNPQFTDGQVQVEANFAATTYRFLTEEERARIAKEKAEAEKKKGKKK